MHTFFLLLSALLLSQNLALNKNFGVDIDYFVMTQHSPLPPAAFLTQTVCLDDTTVKFEIWDTAGQERYHSLAPMYYRGAQAAIVVYDITNEARSFNKHVQIVQMILVTFSVQ